MQTVRRRRLLCQEMAAARDEAVRWSDGADGRLPRLAQRRVILFFWPTLASSANQTSMLLGSRPRSCAIASTVAGQFF
jgi:hypothetical protein